GPGDDAPAPAPAIAGPATVIVAGPVGPSVVAAPCGAANDVAPAPAIAGHEAPPQRPATRAAPQGRARADGRGRRPGGRLDDDDVDVERAVADRGGQPLIAPALLGRQHRRLPADVGVLEVGEPPYAGHGDLVALIVGHDGEPSFFARAERADARLALHEESA